MQERTIALTNAEAKVFVDSSTEVLVYVSEHMGTARVFCPGPSIVEYTSRVGLETARVRKALEVGVQMVNVDAEAATMADVLAQCSVRITRHLDLVTAFSLVGGSVATVGGILAKKTWLVYFGLGLSAAAQVFGPNFKIPLLEK